MIVQVRPIDKGDVKLGLEKYNLTRSPGSGFYIEALVNPRTSLRDTGLTAEDATRLGKAIGEDLTPTSPYWDSFRIKIEDKTLVLDLDSAVDQVRYAVLRANKYVANSETEWRNGLWPDATVIIINPDEEVKVKGAVYERKKQAISRLDAMLPSKQKWFATAMFRKTYENMLAPAASNDIMAFIETSGKNVDTWLEWMKKSDERIEAEYLLNLGVIYNVLRLSSQRYMRGDTEIGFNLQNAIDYILSPSRQDVRLQIENEIASKAGLSTVLPQPQLNTPTEEPKV